MDLQYAKTISIYRGAATMQLKGFYKTGREMLQDRVTAYKTGAKYVIIFNYPINPLDNPHSILTDEHFNAIQEFLSYMQHHPEEYRKTESRAALVLPMNHGWGMCHPDDRIWGYWRPDEKSQQIWELSQYLLAQYGLALEIVYDDPNFPIADINQEVYYWNYIK